MFVGLGFTKDLKTRMHAHKLSLKKNRLELNLLETKYFEKGKDALAIETIIKQRFQKFPNNVKGFKEEAFFKSDKEKIIAFFK